MSDNKIPEELYNEVKNLNEQAYKFAHDIWAESDKLDGSEAEDLKEEASIIQSSFFRRLFDQLEESKKKLILNSVLKEKKLKLFPSIMSEYPLRWIL